VRGCGARRRRETSCRRPSCTPGARSDVRACIAELPAQYRAVVLLRDVEDLDTGAAAALLAISENAVKVRLHGARQALVTLLRRRPAGRRGVRPGGRVARAPGAR
jgi:hypothetical protein